MIKKRARKYEINKTLNKSSSGKKKRNHMAKKKKKKSNHKNGVNMI